MPPNIRRFSLAQAAARASEIALTYARANSIDGPLVSVSPDAAQTEQRGKTPIHWTAVFESAFRGVTYDGPLIVLVNIESETALPFESP